MKGSKLDPWVVHAIFVDYDDASKAYKIYNPQNKKIVITKDVVFNDSTPSVPKFWKKKNC